MSSVVYASACRELLDEGKAATNAHLDADVDRYLLLLATSTFTSPDIGYDTPICVEYMEAQASNTHVKTFKLKKTADTCLIVSSLVPFTASRFGITPRYFISFGQTAFYDLAVLHNDQLYAKMSNSFGTLRDVLEAAFARREYSKDQLVQLMRAESKTAQEKLGSNVVFLKR